MEDVNKRAVGALVVAELISTLGSRMTYLALPWFVLVTTGSAAKMSVVLAVQILPMAILGVPSGSLVQKLGSRTTMLVADFARAPLIMALPLLYSAGLLSFGVLLGIVAAIGAFMPPYAASQRVILPELVGEDVTTMAQANSLLEGGFSAAGLIGPALAGILIPFLGAPERPLHRRSHVPRRIHPRPPVRPAPEAPRPGGRRRAAGRLALRRAGLVHGRPRARDRGLRLLQLGAVRRAARTCLPRFR